MLKYFWVVFFLSISAVTAVDSGSKALEFLGLHNQDDQIDADIPSLSPDNHQQVYMLFPVDSILRLFI